MNFSFIATFAINFILFFAAVDCYYGNHFYDDFDEEPYPYGLHQTHFDTHLRHPHFYASVKAGGKRNKQFDYKRRSRYRPPSPPPPIDGDDEEESLHYKFGDQFGYYESHGGGNAFDAPSRRSAKRRTLVRSMPGFLKDRLRSIDNKFGSSPFYGDTDEEESMHFKNDEEFNFYESNGGVGTAPSRRAITSFLGLGHRRRRRAQRRALY
jgi:hypothetical protein